jgi:hypothetical protein
MDPGIFKERFEKLIVASDVPLTPHASLELMIRFHGEDPAYGYLSCARGVVTRYGEEEFGFHITRWFYAHSDDPGAAAPSTPDLIFKIVPRAQAVDFPGWMNRCQAVSRCIAFCMGHATSTAFWGMNSASKWMPTTIRRAGENRGLR